MTDDQWDDLSYYRQRAAQEEAAAGRAACYAARERHQELADAYHFRCRALSALGAEEASTAPFIRLPSSNLQPMMAA